MDNISTDATNQPTQPSDADVQARIAALAATCASSLSDIIADIIADTQDAVVELAERFAEVKDVTDPVDFWQLILEHIGDDGRALAMELFGGQIIARLGSLLTSTPIDVLGTRMANHETSSSSSNDEINARLRAGEFTLQPKPRGDGAVNYVGKFDFAHAASLRPLKPKTHRDRMRDLVTKLLAESPKVEDATADDIGAFPCIIILRGGYQSRGVLKPSGDNETLRFMTVSKVNTDRGERVHAMEMVFDYEDLMAIVTEKAVADADKPGGIFG